MARSEGTNSINCQIPIFVFLYVAKNIEGWLNLCVSYVGYNQSYLAKSSPWWWPLFLYLLLLKNNVLRNARRVWWLSMVLVVQNQDLFDIYQQHPGEKCNISTYKDEK
jgi:hypothetical protein